MPNLYEAKISASELKTETFELSLADGCILRGEIDTPPAKTRARCILLPAFGLTSLDLLAAAYYLICNGFEVVRFDPTCHVGTSDGEVRDFRLGRLMGDIDRVVAEFADLETSVVGISLSSRPAFRALAHHSIRAVFFLSPVVNTRQTLYEVCGEDLIGKYLDQSLPELYSILGLEVEKEFCGDCLAQKFASLDDTLLDAPLLNAPTKLIVGSQDRWVLLKEVSQVAEVMQNAQIVTVNGANHQMFRSPVIFQSYLTVLLEEMFTLYALQGTPVVPRFADVVKFVNSVKRERRATAERRTDLTLQLEKAI